MKQPLSERYTILRHFSRLCEYMYRKGVMDSAELCSETYSQKFLDENDKMKNLKFIFDEDGRDLRLEVYCSILANFLIRVRARRGADILDNLKVSRMMRIGAAALANTYYRKGVADGIGVDLKEAKAYYNEDRTYATHKKMNGEKYNFLDFYSNMQMEALRLDIDKNEAGYKIWRFICAALQEYYARKSDRTSILDD